ncbi:MAG: winged helix DNA-binding domain-containing protein [Oscillospiraceae bacterium]|nr:winged helix DNA-binding domain-containing protein [Oscillospiraceae bacterium]
MLCRYHNLDGAEELSGQDGVKTIMRRIHSIQYDPLNVVSRNADLVLQARVKDYKEQYLYDLLYKEHELVDGYDKEMCIYNSEDFSRFGFVRKEFCKRVVLTLEYRNQTGALDILDEVKNFVSQHGITGTKDISIGETGKSSWGHRKLSSAALDYLFNSGELCVADKRGTQKYFDLTERVLRGEFLQYDSNMTMEDFLEWYTERRIQSVGFVWNKPGGAWQGCFFSEKDIRTSALQSLLEKNKIEEIQIEGIKESFYVSSNLKKHMDSQASDTYVRFIAPLDNIMWDRQMLESLFDFTYRWEVYTPAAKRKFGYYVLTVLYNGRFVARFEPEPVNKAGAFIIKNWWWESGINPNKDMKEAITKEMTNFANFLGVDNSKDNFSKLEV